MPRPDNLVDWTPKKVAYLTRRWNEGASLQTIGDELKISKHAVKGKVHRLGLTLRENPIKKERTEPLKPSTVQRKAREACPRASSQSTLPLLPSLKQP